MFYFVKDGEILCFLKVVLNWPFPKSFIGNENYPTIIGATSFNYPTIFGQNVTITFVLDLGDIFTVFCENVKLAEFLKSILTDLGEKFYIFNCFYFLELIGVYPKSKNVEFNASLGIIDRPFK